MKKQTAVQWLQQSLSLTFEQKMSFEGLFQQALEMEKEYQDDLAIEFAEWCIESEGKEYNKYKYRNRKELLEMYKETL